MEGRKGLTLGGIDRRTCLGVLAASVTGMATSASATRRVRRTGPTEASTGLAWNSRSSQPPAVTTPRLLFTREELSRMRGRATHPQLVRFRDAVMTRADICLTAPPIVPSVTARGEPDPPGEDKGLACARALQGRVFSLGMAWELTGESRYLESAVTQLGHAVREWRIWVDTAHQPPFDLMTGELSLTFGVAIDWLLAAADPAQRAALVDGVVRRALDPYLEAIERPSPPGWHTAHHNWNTVCNGGAVMLALALQPASDGTGSLPASPATAPTLADKSARVLARAVPAMDQYWNHLGDDGGWDEGTGYWRYGHRYALMAAEALRRTGHPAGDAVFARSGVRRTGYFPIVFNPGRTLAAGFGDSNSRASDAIFYFLGARYQDPAFIWHQDRVPMNPSRVGWADEALALVWRPVDEPWLPERQVNFRPDLPTAAVFPSIGWALLAPAQPDPPHFVSFKNGSLAANHTHLDLNHVSFGIGEEMLLIELGNRPYPADYFRADRRYTYYEIGTRGHNTVLVGGRGQVHRREGRLLPLVERAGVRVLTGVADNAYEVPVPVARRHVCTLDNGQTYLVIDEIETPEPQPIELRWHTSGTWAPGAGGQAVVRGSTARAAVSVACTGAAPTMAVQTPDGWIRPVSVLSVLAAPARKHLVATLILPNQDTAPMVRLTADATHVVVGMGKRTMTFVLSPEHGLQPA